MTATTIYAKPMADQGHVYIILVNWNGWRDTIECLESLYRLTYGSYTVIVCDNASTDGSVSNIIRWAEGTIAADSRNPAMAGFSSPPIAKPVSYVVTDAGLPVTLVDDDSRLVLIEMGSNPGFAAASNMGMRFALAQTDAAYLWLLNNDTVVEGEALSQLIQRIEDKPGAGLCGSTLLFYDNPKYAQACGGSRYSRWTSRGGHIAAGRPAAELPGRAWVEQQLSYIVGASMLATRQFVEDVGLMNEKYFLYFEEVDWAVRGGGRFSLAYAPRSLVYHKVGATIGSAARSLYQSERADYWGTRNRIAFTWAHFWYALPSVYCCVLASALLRLFHGRFRNCLAVLSGGFRPAIARRWSIDGRVDEGGERVSGESQRRWFFGSKPL